MTGSKENLRCMPLLPLILCAMFIALTAIFSQIFLPLPFTPVPVSLATLAVLLAGGLLGPFWGTASQCAYILLGICGLPVFAGFTGGLGILSGPTGGYIIGYAVAALITGFLAGRLTRCKGRNAVKLSLAMLLGFVGCYTLGTAWFMFSTHTGLIPALTACVLPFLPGDILKIALAVLLIRTLRPALPKLYPPY